MAGSPEIRLADLLSSETLPPAEDIVDLLDSLVDEDAPFVQFYPVGYTHAESPYATYLEHVIPPSQRAPLREGDLERMRAGRAHEERVFEILASRFGDRFVLLDSPHDASLAEKRLCEAETVRLMVAGIRAMRAGSPERAPVIAGGRLPAAFVKEVAVNLVGKPDLLVPDAESGTYVFCDVKDSALLEGTAAPREWMVVSEFGLLLSEAVPVELSRGTPKRKQRYQLAHYVLQAKPLFEALGVAVNPTAGILDRDGNTLWLSVEERIYGRGRDKASAHSEYVELVADWLEIDELGRRAAAGEQVVLPARVNAAKRAACHGCPFRQHCAAERILLDDLSRHPDIGPESVGKVASLLSTPTLTALACSRPEELATRAVEAEVSGFGRTVEAVAVAFTNLVDGARAIRQNKTYRRRDQVRVPRLEAVVELHVDLENITAPKRLGSGLVLPAGYLAQTGVVTKIGVEALGEVSTRYTAFIADGTPESEADRLSDWWRLVERRRTQAEALYEELVAEHGKEALAGVVPFRIFTYTKAEHRIWRAKSRQFVDHPGVPTVEELEELLELARPGRPESAVVVDLCAFVETYLHLPLEDRSLKTVAPYVGHYWTVKDPSGDTATLRIADLYSGDPELAAAADRWLRAYNRGDCLATLAIRRWVDVTPFKGVERLDAEGVFDLHIPARHPWPPALPVAEAV